MIFQSKFLTFDPKEAFMYFVSLLKKEGTKKILVALSKFFSEELSYHPG